MKALLFVGLAAISYGLLAQPTSPRESITIRRVSSVDNSCVRIDHHPQTGELYYATIDGRVVKVNPDTGREQLVFSSSDHGLSAIFGFEIGASGSFYLVDARQSSGSNIATVKKHSDGVWITMATARYPEASGRDHQFNAVIESPDQQYILINSGSRTDHGEANSNGSRELGITSKILKLPIGAERVELPNDIDQLESEGYIFAAGVRNTFDLAYAPNGDLFGVENSDTRDNEEELNWLREGHHYGFPWRIGTHENPQQFPGYNPPDADPLVVDGINMESTFHNDPNFPPPASGVKFTGPVINHGPDADSFRDTVDAQIKDASTIGRLLGTFTPHSSPVGLTFDMDSALEGEYRGRGFAMSYNDASLKKYAPFKEPGEDLLMLDLTKTGGNYVANVYRIASGFNSPVDATLVGNKMYVIENGEGASLWEVTLPAHSPGTVTAIRDQPSGIHSIRVYPNAFDREVNVDFGFDHAGSGEMGIYSQEGRLINVLWSGSYRAHEQFRVVWDGTSAGGTGIASGVYFLQVKTDRGTYQHRIIRE